MSFYTDVIQKDPRFGSPDTISDLGLLEPGTRLAVQQFIALARVKGHDVRLAETYRSQVRQHVLFTRGLTQLSKVGVHGFGLAADLNLYIDGVGGKSIYDPDGQHYAFFQAMAVQFGLISGQGWGTPNAHHTFTDWDHLQRVPVFRQAALFDGSWYPPEHYDPYADMRSANIYGMAATPRALPPTPSPVQPQEHHPATTLAAAPAPLSLGQRVARWLLSF